ncbi:MAG: DUF1844 domain-containing protein [Thermoanaerobaculia bacterium]
MADEERDQQARDIKVTDRRMFTPDGRLKEEYRWLEEAKASADEPEREPAGPRSAADAATAKEPAGEPPPPPAGTPLELPDTPDSMGKPGFLDLIAVLAEPATIYLGDAALPDGRPAEDLRAARLYIDLLTVLREKTNGNLSAQEQAVLDDLLYRLQMRYLQKRG